MDFDPTTDCFNQVTYGAPDCPRAFVSSYRDSLVHGQSLREKRWLHIDGLEGPYALHIQPLSMEDGGGIRLIFTAKDGGVKPIDLPAEPWIAAIQRRIVLTDAYHHHLTVGSIQAMEAIDNEKTLHHDAHAEKLRALLEAQGIHVGGDRKEISTDGVAAFQTTRDIFASATDALEPLLRRTISAPSNPDAPPL